MPTNFNTQTLLDNIIEEISQKTFEEAQRFVPSKSGTLKQSGSVSKTATGFEITYTAKHASTIHEGKSDLGTGIYIMQVPAHTRQTRTGYTQVRAHTKTFKPGYKPTIRPDGTWYTSSTTTQSSNRTTPWVQDAWTRVRRSLDSRFATLLPKKLIVEEI